ncbi:MAG: peptide-methionine (S)-S-oxide reductase MsrA [Pirellulales bacterium]|jgi:peptide-methionine (S)-S-oxide reductase|nr:peptide-methionine (S)-S-oxide reductase MsrA [Pirellulales bacterium]
MTGGRTLGAGLVGMIVLAATHAGGISMANDAAPTLAKATFAGGCFWCTEAVFEQIDGVKGVVSGYIGGEVPNPTYKDVCTGLTGHAEAVEIEYDPAVVSYPKLLEVFFATHDPTTKNRQGADVGTQYRSGIFYHDDEQKRIAEEVIKRLNEAAAYPQPIVTEVTKATTFYPAEDYHQDYFANNPGQGYCRAVVAPKVDKVQKVFRDLLKR